MTCQVWVCVCACMCRRKPEEDRKKRGSLCELHGLGLCLCGRVCACYITYIVKGIMLHDLSVYICITVALLPRWNIDSLAVGFTCKREMSVLQGDQYSLSIKLKVNRQKESSHGGYDNAFHTIRCLLCLQFLTLIRKIAKSLYVQVNECMNVLAIHYCLNVWTYIILTCKGLVKAFQLPCVLYFHQVLPCKLLIYSCQANFIYIYYGLLWN